LRGAGWTVLRLTADDVLRRPHETVALVAAALAERR
jgi:very-short-patch-repair endonuclease